VADHDVAPALVNLLVTLADNKYWLGRHLSEWAVGSPSLEVGVACAAVAQGELGQARVLYPLLQALPFPEPVDPTERTSGYQVSMLDRPFPTWPHAVAALLLVDTAATLMLQGLIDNPYQPLARRVPRMLEEEAFHWDFAEGRVRELVHLPGGRQQLQARIDESLAELLGWFGDDQRLRQTYLDRIGPALEAAGVQLRPSRGQAGDDQPVTCPWCGADQVQQVGMVGPTVMTSAWICTACHSPFERVRSRGGRP
jgi:ring-1,2-phenylacetyl-CoA epoxidase subunit PaaC